MRASFLPFFLASLGVLAGCGGGSAPTTGGSGSGSGGSGTTPANMLPIAVSGGPTANQPNGSLYQNAAFASVKVCAPGSTSNCATIDNLLVDTGSTGLRVFDTEVASLGLPAVNAANGAAAYDCVNFVDGSFMWGPVQEADLTLGGETASSVPIHVVSSSPTDVPATCSNGDTTEENTAATLGANGILGVGLEPTDCFLEGVSVCDPASGLQTPPTPAYYTCSATACEPAFIAKQSQITNPVVRFATDNNGVIMELPAASGNMATLNGDLVFGIGTQANNQLPSTATVLTLTCNAITTDFDGQSFGVTDPKTCTGPASFIDSGSNALFFPNVPNIPACSSSTPVGNLEGFYCPTAVQNLSATNQGADGKMKQTSFSVNNAEQIFMAADQSTLAVLPELAGENPSGYGFDWGLPFFYGVNVYNAIDGQTMPKGIAAAPWWAY